MLTFVFFVNWLETPGFLKHMSLPWTHKTNVHFSAGMVAHVVFYSHLMLQSFNHSVSSGINIASVTKKALGTFWWQEWMVSLWTNEWMIHSTSSLGIILSNYWLWKKYRFLVLQEILFAFFFAPLFLTLTTCCVVSLSCSLSREVSHLAKLKETISTFYDIKTL